MEQPVTYAHIAAQLGTSGGAAKVAAHRLRQEFAAVLRAVGATPLDCRPGATLNADAERTSVLVDWTFCVGKWLGTAAAAYMASGRGTTLTGTFS